MADTLDALVIMGVLLVAVWIGFLILAVQWVLNHAVHVFGAVVVLIGVAVVVHEVRRTR